MAKRHCLRSTALPEVVILDIDMPKLKWPRNHKKMHALARQSHSPYHV